MTLPVVTRVYMKPLLPKRPFRGLSFDAIVRRTKGELLKRMKEKLQQTTFTDRAKKALAKALKVEIKPSSLVLTANHPAFFPLVKGQKTGQMKWLTKARRPIPIVLDSGELIFRNATVKSMGEISPYGRIKGLPKWTHPGREPSDFIENAKKLARDTIKKRLMDEVRAKLRSNIKRGR